MPVARKNSATAGRRLASLHTARMGVSGETAFSAGWLLKAGTYLQKDAECFCTGAPLAAASGHVYNSQAFNMILFCKQCFCRCLRVWFARSSGVKYTWILC